MLLKLLQLILVTQCSCFVLVTTPGVTYAWIEKALVVAKIYSISSRNNCKIIFLEIVDFDTHFYHTERRRVPVPAVLVTNLFANLWTSTA